MKDWLGEQRLDIFGTVACSVFIIALYVFAALFAAEGDERNRLAVMYCCDIALNHMAASLPQKMGMEIRKERYERAVKWLEGVQAGKIVPDLPVVLDEDGQPVSGTFIYGCQKKQRYNW